MAADNQPPPILRSWAQLYALVLASTAVLIAVLSLISREYLWLERQQSLS